METEHHPLHILFFPLMAPGHMLPMIDMAVLFSSRGGKSTILTTPGNIHRIQPSIDHVNAHSGNKLPMQLTTIPFPTVDSLPPGCENISNITEDLHLHFFAALAGLRQSFDDAVKLLNPDCIISDIFFPWTVDVAAEHGIPRILFHGSNFFCQCLQHYILENKLIEGGDDTLVLDHGLPHRIELRRSAVPDLASIGAIFVDIFMQITAAESKNYGTVVNTFYELEPGYFDYFVNVMHRRAWAIGPLSMIKSRAEKNNEPFLNWLDNKEPGSVVYVCFGSLSDISTAQIKEIAHGLMALDRPFVWVVRVQESGDEWMPLGLEDKGMIVRGWAPQRLILNHKAVGGFLTHCGWNSILEGVCAGLAFVTWPLFADQFYNEKLIVDVLGIGIALGSDEYVVGAKERKVFEAARVEAAIKELMGEGEEAVERRRKARELGELAFKAMEEGGSSYNDLDSLIGELMEVKKKRMV